jgi:hypothetical protein
MDKLKANMAAAKMLGLVEPHKCMLLPAKEDVVLYGEDQSDEGLFTFDLFTNPSDLVAVVKCLGEKHYITIHFDVDAKHGWGYDDNDEVMYSFAEPWTHEEAVGAACIATQEGV